MATLSAQAAARIVSEDLIKDLHFDAERVVNSFVSPHMQIQPLSDVIAMSKGASVSIDFYPVGEDLDSTRKSIRGALRKWGAVRIDNHNDPVKSRVWRVTFVDPSAAGLSAGGDDASSRTSFGALVCTVIVVLAISIAFFVTPSTTLRGYIRQVSPSAATMLDSVVHIVSAWIGHKSV